MSIYTGKSVEELEELLSEAENEKEDALSEVNDDATDEAIDALSKATKTVKAIEQALTAAEQAAAQATQGANDAPVSGLGTVILCGTGKATVEGMYAAGTTIAQVAKSAGWITEGMTFSLVAGDNMRNPITKDYKVVAGAIQKVLISDRPVGGKLVLTSR